MIRISATIPEALVAAADERAKRLDRSRSWVISEALRRYFKV
jgi:metal-responsive CopG/Arc/MetJ family transcriptional regulator